MYIKAHTYLALFYENFLMHFLDTIILYLIEGDLCQQFSIGRFFPNFAQGLGMLWYCKFYNKIEGHHINFFATVN